MLRDVSAPLPTALGLAGPRERLCQFAHRIVILKRLIKVILLLLMSLKTSLSTQGECGGEEKSFMG